MVLVGSYASSGMGMVYTLVNVPFLLRIGTIIQVGMLNALIAIGT